MSNELASNKIALQRFLREARSAAAVVHDHIVTIFSIDDTHHPPLLVMEYVEGETIGQRIKRDGAFCVEEVVRIGRQIAEGLGAAHAKGLIHRDVKPSNILLEKSTGRAKITDFGLARAADNSDLTGTGMILGTPQYMSPRASARRGGRSAFRLIQSWKRPLRDVYRQRCISGRIDHWCHQSGLQ